MSEELKIALSDMLFDLRGAVKDLIEVNHNMSEMQKKLTIEDLDEDFEKLDKLLDL